MFIRLLTSFNGILLFLLVYVALVFSERLVLPLQISVADLGDASLHRSVRPPSIPSQGGVMVHRQIQSEGRRQQVLIVTGLEAGRVLSAESHCREGVHSKDM